MKIFSWNIRGLNVASKHRILRKNLDQEKEDIVMLQETKCDSRNMELIARKIWNSCDLICSEVDGALGGISLLWNPNKIKVDMVSQTNRIITISYKIF
jgi:exonuclease III